MRNLLLLIFMISLWNCELSKPSTDNYTSRLAEKELRTIDIHPGEELFEGNCNSCHAIEKDLTGPALKGVTKRHSREWLLKFTINSQWLIYEGDKEAIALYNKWGKAVMPSFNHLDSTEIMLIYDYIEAESKN